MTVMGKGKEAALDTLAAFDEMRNDERDEVLTAEEAAEYGYQAN